MRTLDNTYCRPTTEAEFNLVCPTRQYIEGRVVFTVAGEPMPHIEPYYLTEIPVQQFIDLLEDRIVPWRLEEVGFEKAIEIYFYEIGISNIAFYPEGRVTFGTPEQDFNIKTFTDLLTLIRFLK